MFGHAARAASRPAAAAAAAAAVANAAQGPAHARAPPSQGAARPVAHPQVHSKIVDRDMDGWVVAEFQDEMVLFQPFSSHEVDEAANTVLELWSGRPHAAATSSTAVPLIAEPGDDLSEVPSNYSTPGSGYSTVTEGSIADAIIEAAGAGSADAAAPGWRKEKEQMETLMKITTRMLRRPGMQREVVMCMMEDVEVRELMLRQCNDLDRYLMAAGIPPNPQLLPSAPEAVATADDGAFADASASAGESAPQGAAAGAGRAGGPNLMSRLVGTVAGALEKAGDALAALGGWLRRYVASAFMQDEEHEAAHDEAEEAELVPGASGNGGPGPSSNGGRAANQVLGGVMVLAVAVFCVAVIRRPLVLRALSRR